MPLGARLAWDTEQASLGSGPLQRPRKRGSLSPSVASTSLSRTHDLSESSVEVRQVGAAGAGGWVGLKYLSLCHAYNQ